MQLARVMKRMGWDPGALSAREGSDIFFQSPVELQIDSVIGELFERVRAHGVRRVVIDGLADLANSADDPLRVRDLLFALTQQFSTMTSTSMFTIKRHARPSTARPPRSPTSATTSAARNDAGGGAPPSR